MTWLEDKIKEWDSNDDPQWLRAQLEIVAGELATEKKAREEVERKFYRADGSFELLDSAEEVTRRRIEAAAKIDSLLTRNRELEEEVKRSENINLIFTMNDQMVRANRGLRVAQSRILQLEEVLRGLVSALDTVHASEEYKGVWQSAYVHGHRYDGPTYTAELTQARDLLTSPSPADKAKKVLEAARKQVEAIDGGDYFEWRMATDATEKAVRALDGEGEKG